MGAEAWIAPEVQQCRRYVVRLERGEADAREAGAVPQRFQHAPRAALFPAPVAPVVAQLGAGEHDLQHALALAGQHLPDDILHGPAALPAAGAGDDAEGAELVAALLDADEGAGAQRLAEGGRAAGGGVPALAQPFEEQGRDLRL